jgi:hypothetical protein
MKRRQFLTALDLIGPYQFLSSLINHQVILVSMQNGHAKWGTWGQLWWTDETHGVYAGAFDPRSQGRP